MKKFIGALQPAEQHIDEEGKGFIVAHERVVGIGSCIDELNAREQLKSLYRKTYPEKASLMDDDSLIFGGIFLCDDRPLDQLIEIVADEESKKILLEMIKSAIFIPPEDNLLCERDES